MLVLIEEGDGLLGVDPSPDLPWPCGHDACRICGTVFNNLTRNKNDSAAWYYY